MLTFSASDDESNRNHVNSDVTNLSDNESDSKLESDHELESDQELESDPEHKSDQETESEGLESDPKANCISADSSFDGNTSTKFDYGNFRLEPFVEEFPWLYYNVLEKGYKCNNCELFPVVETLLTNLEVKLSKVSPTIQDACYNDTWNPKNIKMPLKSMKVCIIIIQMIYELHI